MGDLDQLDRLGRWKLVGVRLGISVLPLDDILFDVGLGRGFRRRIDVCVMVADICIPTIDICVAVPTVAARSTP